MNNFYKTSIFLTLLLATCSLSVEAQQWSRHWRPGQLALISGDTLLGDIRYDIDNDAVQIRMDDDRLHSYSGKKVVYFEIEEHPRRSKRRFYSLPYQQRNNFYSTRLFEVLFEGKLTLLCRPYYEHLVYESEEEVSSGKKKSDPVYEYYFLDGDGQVHLYRPRLGRLMSIMSSKHREIRNYMKEHHLRYDEMRDLVRITAYYNALPAQTQTTIKDKDSQPE